MEAESFINSPFVVTTPRLFTISVSLEVAPSPPPVIPRDNGWPVTPDRRQSQEAIHNTSHYCQSPVLSRGYSPQTWPLTVISEIIIMLSWEPMRAESGDEGMTGACQDVTRCHNQQPTASHERQTRHKLSRERHKCEAILLSSWVGLRSF